MVDFLDDEDRSLNFGKLGNFSITGFKMSIHRDSSNYITYYFVPSGNIFLISTRKGFNSTTKKLMEFSIRGGSGG